jgi:N-acetylglucosamine-6-phosphate deacetylase
MSGQEIRDFQVVNARIVTPSGVLNHGSLKVKDGIIYEISDIPDTPDSSLETIDAQGSWLLPGFIDVHVHGGAGHDFMDADEEGLTAITKFHATHGTTRMLATTLTASRDELTAVVERISLFMSKPMSYAQIVGVHLEGPFVNVKMKGAKILPTFSPRKRTG